MPIVAIRLPSHFPSCPAISLPISSLSHFHFLLPLIGQSRPLYWSLPLSAHRDAVMLSTACRALRSAVASSKWPPWSPTAHVLPDGTVLEPLSGRFAAICKPEEGGEGIQRAIDACEVDGGAILLEEGEYKLDLALHVDPGSGAGVHLFGRGRARLVGRDRRDLDRFPALVHITGPCATLDGLAIRNFDTILEPSDNDDEEEEDGYVEDYKSAVVHVRSPGRVRLQGCHLRTPSIGCDVVWRCSSNASGSSFEIVGGSVRGGKWGISLTDDDSLASVTGCRIEGCKLAGVCVSLFGDIRPLLARQTHSDGAAADASPRDPDDGGDQATVPTESGQAPEGLARLSICDNVIEDCDVGVLFFVDDNEAAAEAEEALEASLPPWTIGHSLRDNTFVRCDGWNVRFHAN